MTFLQSSEVPIKECDDGEISCTKATASADRMPSLSASYKCRNKSVHFDESFDWGQEAKRSERGQESRRLRKRQHKERKMMRQEALRTQQNLLHVITLTRNIVAITGTKGNEGTASGGRANGRPLEQALNAFPNGVENADLENARDVRFLARLAQEATVQLLARATRLQLQEDGNNPGAAGTDNAVAPNVTGTNEAANEATENPTPPLHGNRAANVRNPQQRQQVNDHLAGVLQQLQVDDNNAGVVRGTNEAAEEADSVNVLAPGSVQEDFPVVPPPHAPQDFVSYLHEGENESDTSSEQGSQPTKRLLGAHFDRSEEAGSSVDDQQLDEATLGSAPTNATSATGEESTATSGEESTSTSG